MHGECSQACQRQSRTSTWRTPGHLEMYRSTVIQTVHHLRRWSAGLGKRGCWRSIMDHPWCWRRCGSTEVVRCGHPQSEDRSPSLQADFCGDGCSWLVQDDHVRFLLRTSEGALCWQHSNATRTRTPSLSTSKRMTSMRTWQTTSTSTTPPTTQPTTLSTRLRTRKWLESLKTNWRAGSWLSSSACGAKCILIPDKLVTGERKAWTALSCATPSPTMTTAIACSASKSTLAPCPACEVISMRFTVRRCGKSHSLHWTWSVIFFQTASRPSPTDTKTFPNPLKLSLSLSLSLSLEHLLEWRFVSQIRFRNSCCFLSRFLSLSLSLSLFLCVYCFFNRRECRIYTFLFKLNFEKFAIAICTI